MNLLAGLVLTCLVQYNGSDIFTRKVQFEPGIQMVSIGEVADYELMIRDLGKNHFELQGYNSLEPSRTYATATIGNSSDLLQLSIWKREHLLEVICTQN